MRSIVSFVNSQTNAREFKNLRNFKLNNFLALIKILKNISFQICVPLNLLYLLNDLLNYSPKCKRDFIQGKKEKLKCISLMSTAFVREPKTFSKTLRRIKVVSCTSFESKKKLRGILYTAYIRNELFFFSSRQPV